MTSSKQAPQDVWGTLSQADRDAAYDNNTAVPNSAELIATRDRLAKAYRRARPGGLDLSYGPKARTALDLFPGSDLAAPCLVFVHGGYWQRNSREVFAHYAGGLAAAGWSVAMPGYSLAPEASVTQIVAEVGAALDWLAREGRAHGVAGPVVIAGWSAGAQLAAMLLDHSSVVAGLAVSGVYDLGPIRDTFFNTALKLSDDEIATLSPLRLPVVNKPLAIAYGTKERPALVDDSRRFHAMREAAGAAGPLIPIEGADHFTILDAFLTREGVLANAAREILEIARRAKSPA